MKTTKYCVVCQQVQGLITMFYLVLTLKYMYINFNLHSTTAKIIITWDS